MTTAFQFDKMNLEMIKIKENFLLTTENLILRNLKKEDSIDWLEIFNSDNVAKFLVKIDNQESIDRLIDKKIAKYQNSAGGSFSVVLKDNQKVIGNIELKVNNEMNLAEISYVFNDKYWNKGYCTECCVAVLGYAFDELKLDKVIADCIASNSASNHILQDKLNMRLIKEETPEGENQKYKFFEITSVEWKSK